MAHWTLDDVPWDQFDRSKLDPELIPIVKAASMVEYRAGTYTEYLHNVFHDDEHFKQEAAAWALEEVQHGQVLGRYAKLCDPDFDFEGCYKRFVEGYALQTEVQESIRGSRAGELIARCIVEVGTSSYYTAMAETTGEPVLQDICKKIAADELRHYKLFYNFMKPYLEKEGLGFWGRLRVAAGRIAESEDDELAYAYYAANGSQGDYDHKRWNQAYARRAYSLYKRHHVERVTSMVFKAVGLKPHGLLNRTATQIMWSAMQSRVKRLQKIAA